MPCRAQPTPVALYRILYGLLVIANLALLHGDWLTWFGVGGSFSMETLYKLSPGIRLNLFLLMPGDLWFRAFFWIFLVFAVFLAVGFLSRLSSIAVFLCLFSIDQRNPHILHSGDTLLRITGLWLIFAPIGAAFSVDRLWHIWRGEEDLQIQMFSPWAQRMIQIQTALVYFASFYSKVLGTDWINGTALYYTTRLAEFQRFPMPKLEYGLIIRLATWFTLMIEFALGVLVWFRKLRYWVLLLGICLHLSIEYSMNIPLFQWIAMATYVTFIDPADLSRVWGWLRRRMAGNPGNTVNAIYDGTCGRAVRLANVLRAIDVLGRLNIVDLNSSTVRTGWPDMVTHERAKLLIVANGSLFEGFKGVLVISRLVPLLWPLAPLSLMSGPGDSL